MYEVFKTNLLQASLINGHGLNKPTLFHLQHSAMNLFTDMLTYILQHTMQIIFYNVLSLLNTVGSMLNGRPQEEHLTQTNSAVGIPQSSSSSIWINTF